MRLFIATLMAILHITLACYSKITEHFLYMGESAKANVVIEMQHVLARAEINKLATAYMKNAENAKASVSSYLLAKFLRYCDREQHQYLKTIKSVHNRKNKIVEEHDRLAKLIIEFRQQLNCESIAIFVKPPPTDPTDDRCAADHCVLSHNISQCLEKHLNVSTLTEDTTKNLQSVNKNDIDALLSIGRNICKKNICDEIAADEGNLIFDASIIPAVIRLELKRLTKDFALESEGITTHFVREKETEINPILFEANKDYEAIGKKWHDSYGKPDQECYKYVQRLLVDRQVLEKARDKAISTFIWLQVSTQFKEIIEQTGITHDLLIEILQSHENRKDDMSKMNIKGADYDINQTFEIDFCKWAEIPLTSDPQKWIQKVEASALESTTEYFDKTVLFNLPVAVRDRTDDSWGANMVRGLIVAYEIIAQEMNSIQFEKHSETLKMDSVEVRRGICSNIFKASVKPMQDLVDKFHEKVQNLMSAMGYYFPLAFKPMIGTVNNIPDRCNTSLRLLYNTLTDRAALVPYELLNVNTVEDLIKKIQEVTLKLEGKIQKNPDKTPVGQDFRYSCRKIHNQWVSLFEQVAKYIIHVRDIVPDYNVGPCASASVRNFIDTNKERTNFLRTIFRNALEVELVQTYSRIEAHILADHKHGLIEEDNSNSIAGDISKLLIQNIESFNSIFSSVHGVVNAIEARGPSIMEACAAAWLEIRKSTIISSANINMIDTIGAARSITPHVGFERLSTAYALFGDVHRKKISEQIKHDFEQQIIGMRKRWVQTAYVDGLKDLNVELWEKDVEHDFKNFVQIANDKFDAVNRLLRQIRLSNVHPAQYGKFGLMRVPEKAAGNGKK